MAMKTFPAEFDPRVHRAILDPDTKSWKLVLEAPTQGDVSAWCEEHYPGKSPHEVLLYVLEEVTELGVELGVPAEAMQGRIADTARRALSKSPDHSKESVAGEIADSLINLYHLASKLSIDAGIALAAKMEQLLKRKPEESRAREIAKQSWQG
jgi:NTP pyrophosphatase (non-canonical NTP hydrolase)